MSHYSCTNNNPIFLSEQVIANAGSHKQWALRFALERAASGTLHYQIYAYNRASKPMVTAISVLAEIFGSPVDITVCSTKEHQRNSYWYPAKPGKDGDIIDGPWEVNTAIIPKFVSSPAELTSKPKPLADRLMEFVSDVKAGFSRDELEDKHIETCCRYPRFVESNLARHQRPRDFMTELIVIVGPSGVGKSRLASAMSPNAFWAFSDKWFDGYDGGSDVIIDNFDPAKVNDWNQFLRMVDRYPLRLETKGGSVNFAPKRIFVTTVFTPDRWSKRHAAEIFRRITHMVEYSPEFGDEFVPDPPGGCLTTLRLRDDWSPNQVRQEKKVFS